MQTELEFPVLPVRPAHGRNNGNARPADQTIGRADELRRAQECAGRRQDTLVLGPAGVGKSHLLARVRGQRLVRVRSLSPARQALLEIAEALFQAGVLRVQPTAVANTAAPRKVRPTTAGQVLLVVINATDLKAELYLPATQLAQVRLHQVVQAVPVAAPAAGPGRPISGRVVHVSPILDPPAARPGCASCSPRPADTTDPAPWSGCS